MFLCSPSHYHTQLNLWMLPLAIMAWSGSIEGKKPFHYGQRFSLPVPTSLTPSVQYVLSVWEEHWLSCITDRVMQSFFFFFFFPKWLHLTASSFCQNMGTAVLSDQQAFTNKCLYILLHCQELHVYFASHLRYWPVRQDWNLAWFPLSSPGEVFNFWISSQHQWETRKGVLFIQISWQELMWTGHSCF